MDWHIPSSAWAALLTPIVIALLFSLAKKPVRPDPDGSVRLRPSLGLYVFGLLFIPFSLFFTAMPALAFFAPEIGEKILFAVLGPPLALLGWYAIYGVFIVRVRFNANGICYRGFRKLDVPWSEVRRIGDSAALGTFISSTKGRLIVWKYLRGFQQLLDEADRHGIAIDSRARSAM